MLSFIKYPNAEYEIKTLFKYISCYLLSVGQIFFRSYVSAFKYISCYLLSCNHALICIPHLHLNTSHVIFYHAQTENAYTWLSNLNTSHVIFYQGDVPAWMYYVKLFKYISCYLLSNSGGVSLYKSANLNTSHVIFYQPSRIPKELRQTI